MTRARPWVVSIGDSYISGEGGRWAGNTREQPGPVDALGPGAYDDRPGGERIPGCHRSKSAEVYVDTAVLRGKNLACSGAQTRSQSDGSSYTPGLDFDHSGRGRVGQLVLLRRFAASHRVRDVVVSIGGNDFGFSTVIEACIGDFTATVTAPKHAYCSKDPQVRALFSAHATHLVEARIEAALRRVRTAMRRAGYTTDRYRIVVQDYPQPLATGKTYRLPQTPVRGLLAAACPFFDRDATFARDTVLSTIDKAVHHAARHARVSDVHFLQLRGALDGHQLCERGVHQIQKTRLRSWRSPGAVDQLEWVNGVYALKPSPWQTQESLHPNYWAQLGLRSCLRQMLSGRRVVHGRCVRAGSGLTARGEPRLRFVR